MTQTVCATRSFEYGKTAYETSGTSLEWHDSDLNGSISRADFKSKTEYDQMIDAIENRLKSSVIAYTGQILVAIPAKNNMCSPGISLGRVKDAHWNARECLALLDPSSVAFALSKNAFNFAVDSFNNEIDAQFKYREGEIEKFKQKHPNRAIPEYTGCGFGDLWAHTKLAGYARTPSK